MFKLIVMHAIFFATILTSVAGAICLLRQLNIINLRMTARNCMYIGACSAMVVGFIGVVFCLGSLVMTQWHYLAIAILGTIGVFATAHVSVDLSARLSL